MTKTPESINEVEEASTADLIAALEANPTVNFVSGLHAAAVRAFRAGFRAGFDAVESEACNVTLDAELDAGTRYDVAVELAFNAAVEQAVKDHFD